MTKLKIISKENKEKGEKQLPAQFKEGVRADLIQRAVLSLQSNKRQRYGAKGDRALWRIL